MQKKTVIDSVWKRNLGVSIHLLNANMIKTKQGSRSRGRESRTKTIRKKVTGILKKKKKQNFEDEDWI